MGMYLSKPDGTESSSQSFPDDFTRRIVILGKTGAGKSSLINTFFGKKVCEPDPTPESGTSKCQAVSGAVNGKNVTFIDTPGFFDTRCEKEMKAEILKCIIECAPGPHVFIIVLEVGKFTEQEKAVIKKMTDYFSDEALKFTTVLFTRGDQLEAGTEIEQFVSQSKELSHIVKKCGNRCNVIDNRYWKKSEHKYRNNEVQMKKLLDTMDKIIEANNKTYYSHEMLQKVTRDLEQEQKLIKQENPNLSPDKVTQKAKNVVHKKFLNYVLRTSSDVLLRAFLGEEVLKQEPMLAAGVALTNIVMAAATRGAGAAVNTEAETPGLCSTAASAEKTAEEQEAVAPSEADRDEKQLKF